MSDLISILIITYNRPADLLELLQSLRMQEDIALINEVLILNNASTVGYGIVEDYIRQNPDLKISYQASNQNLGVSRGRNELMHIARGRLLLVLDDDVLFTTPKDLLHISEAFNKPLFAGNNTGILTFRVIYNETLEVQKTAFPHKSYNDYKELPEFLTSYFTGCSHLIRKEVLDKTGYYPLNFFYGMEEYDLSYRVINAGYSLGYTNTVTFIHKESPKGRQPGYVKLASQWKNKSIVAWRYLPLRYFISTAIAWNFEYLRKAGKHVGFWLKTWSRIFSIPFREKRTPVNAGARKYLKSVKARLRY